jgi:imidazolonepropionase
MSAAPAADLVVHGIGRLVTPAASSGAVRGADLHTVHEVEGAAVAMVGGRVIAAGAESHVHGAITTDESTRFIDAQGTMAIPGLVDCHAHPVFAGDRVDEFELRCAGASYEQLHAAGGGIHNTVTSTRAALDDGTILTTVRRHLDWMLAAGTTTTEAKSGYALTCDGELASLRAAHQAAADHPVRITGTLLAAHTVPAEADDGDAYLEQHALPAIELAADEGLASAADVFLERGSFTFDQARRYLTAGMARGMTARLHADQFSDQGGIDLAIEIGARSVDHLEALDDPARLARLAGSDVTAVLLPLSSLFLNRPWAPGRALADAGAIVAVASDFNPGSSYGESLTMAMTLACTGCGLRPTEAFNAVTRNAAHVLGLDDAGHLSPGARADLLLLDQPDIRHLAYHAGTSGLQVVIADGAVAWVAGGRPPQER